MNKTLICSFFLFYMFSLFAAPIDPNATLETRNLYYNLKRLSETKIIFGHQYSYRNGISFNEWQWDNPSDIFQISNDEPALVGTDYREIDNYENLRQMHREKMIEVYERNGILTMSWHVNNPVTNGPHSDRTLAVSRILPNGSHHEIFKRKLDRLADFLNNLRDSRGRLIPIIFRPWHEHNGNWFWWGRGYRTDSEFILLWRFTVNYLMNVKNVHNVLYAYSPGAERTLRYRQGFPGVNFVDIYGLDGYADNVNNFMSNLEVVVSLARLDNKISALTETGSRGIPNRTYWTSGFLSALKRSTVRSLAYVMLWSNRTISNNEYFVPFVGHPSVNNFLAMKRDNYILFQSNLPCMY